MNKILKHSLLTALALGLMSGSAMAHEQKYDNTKEPHESAHDPEPKSGGGGHGSLANAATNPIANLVQFQIQNAYTPNNNNVSGSSNAFIIQPVYPIKLGWEAVPLLVTRTTLPYINTPDFDGGIGTQEGFGDIVAQGYFIPKLDTKGLTMGVGYNLTVPTAGSNDFTGSGKWSLGPAAVFLNTQTKGIQWGLLGYSSFSFASQDTSRSHVSSISLQPPANFHFDKGWYASWADVPSTYNYKTEHWTTAIGARIGKVMKFGQQPVNLFYSQYWNSEDHDNEISPDWTYKVNLTFLFPA